ncbi:hypothetical protein BBJ28_00003381 [Nothophytophthora sp. Chile5]|nr:hypothetical protein BBJ28_00003381 [Nothophytophthora sp. Chile5]
MREARFNPKPYGQECVRRIQNDYLTPPELSLRHAAGGGGGSPKRKQWPSQEADERRDDDRILKGPAPRDRSAAVMTALAANLARQPDRKRSNKRSVLSPSASQRRPNGESVKVEGLLVVAEQIERRQAEPGPSVFRTLGSIHCVLVLKNSGLVLETVSQDSHHEHVLDMNCMDLVYEPFQRDRKFQLRYRPDTLRSASSSPGSASYAFLASSDEEYRAWINGILDHQVHQVSTRNSGQGQGAASDDTSKSSSATASDSTDARQSGRASAGSNGTHEQSTQPNQLQEAYQQPQQPSVGAFVYSTPPKTKHFILVRHGHYINAHVPQVADSQQVLSQMGRQQAGLTGKYLELLHTRSPTRRDLTIYHSDMTRAVETATIIGDDFSDCSLNPSRLLREGWPGLPYATDYPIGPAAAARNSSALDAAIEERNRVDAERMEKAFSCFFSVQEENDEESYCVIVCHANLIRFFLCRALGVDPVGTWGHFEINHCGVTRIDVCANRPLKVVAVNETGHLPHSLITSSEDHL